MARPWGRLRILLVGDQSVTFISDYRKILEEFGEVRCTGTVRRKAGFVPMLTNLYSLILGVIWADVTVTYFMDLDAALAALIGRPIRKRSLAVIAGYEVHREDGNAVGLKAFFPKMAVLFSNGVIAVHEDLRHRAIQEYGALPDRIKVINAALDPTGFPSIGEDRRFIITVGMADCEARIRVKGLDIFVMLAKANPDLEFVVVGAEGKASEVLSLGAPPNLRILGLKDRTAVVDLLNASKVYCQLSRREGFPIAICEAMLCGCVPMGSDIPGIRSIVGDVGAICKIGDVESASKALREALSMDGSMARKSILDRFTMPAFREGVKMALNDVMVGNPIGKARSQIDPEDGHEIV